MTLKHSFANSYEKLLDNQKSNILRAFLGLQIHYVVGEEFKSHYMEFTFFSQLTSDEKEKLKNELCNNHLNKNTGDINTRNTPSEQKIFGTFSF